MGRIKKSSKKNKKNLSLKKPNSKKKLSLKKKKICPNGLKKIKIKGETICVGRCPHSGGEIFYKPKIKKLECNLHQALFETNGKYISGPPMGQNLLVK